MTVLCVQWDCIIHVLYYRWVCVWKDGGMNSSHTYDSEYLIAFQFRCLRAWCFACRSPLLHYWLMFVGQIFNEKQIIKHVLTFLNTTRSAEVIQTIKKEAFQSNSFMFQQLLVFFAVVWNYFIFLCLLLFLGFLKNGWIQMFFSKSWHFGDTQFSQDSDNLCEDENI